MSRREERFPPPTLRVIAALTEAGVDGQEADAEREFTAAVVLEPILGEAGVVVPPAGFLEVYGDYGELAITNTGKSIAIWGEGISYTGPGGVWFNREP